MNPDRLVRPNIRSLAPYRSAREEHPRQSALFLDANENSFGSPGAYTLNRYPDPLQKQLKQALAPIKRVAPEEIFTGNGSDEAIDLLMRAFCEPGKNRIVITPPTYGMYRVCAHINNVAVDEALLNDDFSLNPRRVLDTCMEHTRLIFLCSPNNPTGNVMAHQSVQEILLSFNGLVVIDEAYIDFADSQSWLTRLHDFDNLVVLQTFSKAWGLAGARLGMAFAHPSIIDILNKIKYPYNVNQLSQKAALDALNHRSTYESYVKNIRRERDWLSAELKKIPFIDFVWPSQANFILIRSRQAEDVYKRLAEKGILIRNRNRQALCVGCLRITVGSRAQNEQLIAALQSLIPLSEA